MKTKTKPKLVSNYGACYVSSDLGKYLNDELNIKQVHGKPGHPQTQGEIERYHRTMKNVVKLDKYYCPEELEADLEKFVKRFNNEGNHEFLNNLTPGDVYYGRGEIIFKRRKEIKTKNINERKNQYFN